MATTKKTETKKTTRAPKKVAPARTAEQIEDAIPTKPEPVKLEEEKKSLMIPLDGSLESKDQFFEYCLNGMNYRFKRGVWHTLPAWLADAIIDKLRMRENVSPFVAEFQNTSKKLN